MLELARRLSTMDSARLADIQELVEKWRTDEMVVEEKEGIYLCSRILFVMLTDDYFLNR